MNCCCPREVLEENLLLFDEDPDVDDDDVEDDEEDVTPLDEELEGRISRYPSCLSLVSVYPIAPALYTRSKYLSKMKDELACR